MEQSFLTDSTIWVFAHDGTVVGNHIDAGLHHAPIVVQRNYVNVAMTGAHFLLWICRHKEMRVVYKLCYYSTVYSLLSIHIIKYCNSNAITYDASFSSCPKVTVTVCHKASVSVLCTIGMIDQVEALVSHP